MVKIYIFSIIFSLYCTELKAMDLPIMSYIKNLYIRHTVNKNKKIDKEQALVYLSRAILIHDFKTTERLLSRGIDAYTTPDNLYTMAIQIKNDTDWNTYLNGSTECNNIKMINLLLEHAVPLNQFSDEAPLFRAAVANQWRVVLQLLAHGASLDSFSLADIVQEIEKNSKEIIKNLDDYLNYSFTITTLLAAGMDPHEKNLANKNAFELTTRRDIIFLLNEGSKATKYGSGWLQMKIGNAIHDRNQTLKKIIRRKDNLFTCVRQRELIGKFPSIISRRKRGAAVYTKALFHIKKEQPRQNMQAVRTFFPHQAFYIQKISQNTECEDLSSFEQLD